jgi:hypothetical protein
MVQKMTIDGETVLGHHYDNLENLTNEYLYDYRFKP